MHNSFTNKKSLWQKNSSYKYVKQTEDKEPRVLESEVWKALQLINNNKSPRRDNTPIELIKAAE